MKQREFRSQVSFIGKKGPYRPKAHVLSEFCWCMPKVEHYEHGDLIIHNEYPAGFKPSLRES